MHKEAIVPATAREGDTEIQSFGRIGGTFDALDKLVKKLANPGACMAAFGPVAGMTTNSSKSRMNGRGSGFRR